MKRLQKTATDHVRTSCLRSAYANFHYICGKVGGNSSKGTVLTCVPVILTSFYYNRDMKVNGVHENMITLEISVAFSRLFGRLYKFVFCPNIFV